MSGRPPVIGLAGGIGAGKSAVAAILADLGAVVSDSDADARAVLAESDVIETVRSWWGGDVITPDGVVDRAAVARRVFIDPAERARLEALVHPRIHARRRARFEAAPASTRAFVIDAPLLFEAGLDSECEAVIFIDAPREVRLARVARDRGWTEAELDRREAAQWPIQRKRERATEIIENTQDDDPTLATRVAATFERLLNPR